MSAWSDYLRYVDERGYFPAGFEAFNAGMAVGVAKAAAVAEADDSWEGDHIASKIRGEGDA